MSITGSFSNAVPLISLYVFAGYRLMPVLQNIYISLNRLSFSQASLDNLYNDIVKLKSNKITKSNKELSFKKEIVLKNVDFSYPNSSKKELKNINLNIPAKSTIGLIGPTGSGKTTVVDVILGLLEVEKGTLEVDEKVITSQNLRSWQSYIGYVPQNIYLSDDTIAANIALCRT